MRPVDAAGPGVGSHGADGTPGLRGPGVLLLGLHARVRLSGRTCGEDSLGVGKLQNTYEGTGNVY